MYCTRVSNSPFALRYMYCGSRFYSIVFEIPSYSEQDLLE